MTTAGFEAFNDDIEDLRAKGVRIFGPDASVAQDLEPEFIAVAEDSQTAWVTLQENNALARLDVEDRRIDAILPLGLKDHSLLVSPEDSPDGRAIRMAGIFGPSDTIEATKIFSHCGSRFSMMWCQLYPLHSPMPRSLG